MATGIAGDFDQKRCVNWGGYISISIRETPQKGVQNRMVERRSHNARAIGGEADLLLMVPALGEFAGIVEPDERSRFSGPRDADRGGGKGVERFIEVWCLGTRELRELNEHGPPSTLLELMAHREDVWANFLDFELFRRRGCISQGLAVPD